MAAAELHSGERTVDARYDHAALAGSHGLALAWPAPCLTQVLFDAIEMLDVQQQPACLLVVACS